MEEDLLTFERLRDIRKEERNTDTLSELEEGFFKKVEDYLERKRRLGSDSSSEEYKNALHMVEDIIDTRAKKVMKIAFLSTKTRIPTKKLLEREKELFDRLKEPLEKHQKILEDIKGENPSEEKEDEESEQETEKTGKDLTDQDSDPDSGEEEETEDGEETEDKEVTEESDTGKEREEVEEDSEPSEDGSSSGKEEMEESSEDMSSEAESGDEEPEEKDSGGELLFDASQSSEKSGKEEKSSEKPKEQEESSEEGAKNGGKSGNEEKEDKTTIRITTDMKEFVSPDMETYGPFEKDEEVEVGKEVAELLVEQGNAERK